jgi:hypothetical protein
VCVGTASIFDGKRVIAIKAADYRFRSLGCWIASAILVPVAGRPHAIPRHGHERHGCAPFQTFIWRSPQ